MNAVELGLSLQRTLRAGARALALLTEEEERAVRLIERIGGAMRWPVHTWSAGRGVDLAGDEPLHSVLDKILAEREDGIWILLDPGVRLDAITLRRLRDVGQRTSGPAVIILSPRLDGVVDVPELVVEALPLPDLDELQQQVEWVGEQLEESGHAGAAARFAAASTTLARASLGLPVHVLDRMIAEAVLEHDVNLDAIEGWIARHKPRALDRRGLLEHVDPVPIGELGGLAAYKRWLSLRRQALDPSARAAGIPHPRGVLLVGVSGCGKSLAARATADELELPLLRLEPGRLFGGTVGESEANLRSTLAVVDRMAPVVLWLDEVDKGLAGVDGSASDGGTTARVIGALLTWLQERVRPVFVVATANDVERMPPELLRRGRLDEVFFVDLPDAEEREVILDVHLRRRPARELDAIPPLADAWKAFAEVAHKATGYSGAEIEVSVVEARLRAFAERRPVAAADVEWALAATVPLSRSHVEHIERLRRWADARARRANATLGR